MADYDSDSSVGDDVETNVLLGYASKEATSDNFSQLGGHPIWIDGQSSPSAALAKCKVCNGWMSLILQLHGDNLDRFPNNERRLYIWSCRRKACRRKEGSMRAFRAVRSSAPPQAPREVQNHKKKPEPTPPTTNLGETLFGVLSGPTPAQSNPFAAPSTTSAAPTANPFAPAPTTTEPQANHPDPDPSTLPETFASKARISSPSPTTSPPSQPHEPWPPESSFPTPYPTYYIDAEKEYLDPDWSHPSTNNGIPSSARVVDDDPTAGGSSIKDAFESSMDKTFQRFADRLAQNPEQVLRYEFAGTPLLYAKDDRVGQMLDEGTGGDVGGMLKRVPRCGNCGAGRVFELQLTPHAIAELEVEDMGVDGMDWGMVVLCVCEGDCVEKGKGRGSGKVGYVEEWVGIQWEELSEKRK